MRSTPTPTFTIFSIFLITILPYVIIVQGHTFSPLSSDLETLQEKLGYNFTSSNLLIRAITHASFSQENNKAFSIAGATIIETTVSFNVLSKDVDISAKELNRVLSLNSNVESSCAVDGMLLGLSKVVRVSSKTNSSSTAVLCGAFRSIFAAIAIDSGKLDTAGNAFSKVHHGDLGVYAAM
ncbi:protein NUCLEAR FUSION DEFECTIVE [Trifolium repens]|nr:protein NUCLEAR FUSION DEFECTIVE [Trifolium repens]